MRNRLLILLILPLFISGCFLLEDGENVPFYERNIGHDVWSIPLLEPCYLGSTTGINGEWNLSNCFGDGSNTVTHANIVDSIIIAYNGDNWLDPNNNDTVWYISIPSITQKLIYNSREAFNSDIIKYTNKNIEFIEIVKLYDELSKKGYLEWYPKEYKK